MGLKFDSRESFQLSHAWCSKTSKNRRNSNTVSCNRWCTFFFICVCNISQNVVWKLPLQGARAKACLAPNSGSLSIQALRHHSGTHLGHFSITVLKPCLVVVLFSYSNWLYAESEYLYAEFFPIRFVNLPRRSLRMVFSKGSEVMSLVSWQPFSLAQRNPCHF